MLWPGSAAVLVFTTVFTVVSTMAAAEAAAAAPAAVAAAAVSEERIIWTLKYSLPFNICQTQATHQATPEAHPPQWIPGQCSGGRPGRDKVLAVHFFFMIFGRAELRIGVSGAKFDTEIDFAVNFAPAPQKLHKIAKHRILRSSMFSKFQKFSECVLMHPKASKCILMHPNVSKSI